MFDLKISKRSQKIKLLRVDARSQVVVWNPDRVFFLVVCFNREVAPKSLVLDNLYLSDKKETESPSMAASKATEVEIELQIPSTWS